MLLARRIDNSALVLAGRALPGGMSSQQGEDEGRAGHDAEFAECHAEVSPRHRRVFSPPLARTRTKDMPAVHFLPLKKKKKNPQPGDSSALARATYALGGFCSPGDVSRCVASGRMPLRLN